MYIWRRKIPSRLVRSAFQWRPATPHNITLNVQSRREKVRWSWQGSARSICTEPTSVGFRAAHQFSADKRHLRCLSIGCLARYLNIRSCQGHIECVNLHSQSRSLCESLLCVCCVRRLTLVFSAFIVTYDSFVFFSPTRLRDEKG